MARLTLRGRSDEISRVLPTLRRVSRTGQSAIIAITGEPGIGKTAIVATIVEQASRMGFATGYGKAEEVDQIAPGAPLLVALRSGANPLLDADAFRSLAPLHGQPLWFIDEVASTLEKVAKQGPVLIAIDDMQWADRLSRFAAKLLPGRLTGSPVVWVLSTRDPANELLSEWATSSVDGVSLQHIVISPLPEDMLDTIATDLLGRLPTGKALERLHSVGGKPLLAVQLLEGLAGTRPGTDDADALPDSLVAAIRSRLLTLEPMDVELLRTAAVWGRPVDIEDLMRLLDEHSVDSVAASVERATALAMLTEQDDTVAFRHDLVREAVYADTPTVRRRSLHRRCARFLLSHGRGALAAAPHALAAATPGDTEAVTILQQAANDTRAAHPEAAAALIRQAFDLLSHPQPGWVTVGEQCAAILAEAQHGRDAITIVDTLLGQPADPDTEARLQVIAANALWLMGLLDDTARRVDTALARPGLSDAQTLRLRAVKARAQVRTINSADAARTARTILDDARRICDEPAELVALQSIGEIAKNEGRHEVAFIHFHSLRQSAGAQYLSQEITELQLLDRYDEAQTLLSAADRNRKSNSDAVMPSLVNARLWQDFYLGRYDQATADAHTIIELSDNLGTYVHKFDAWQLLSMMSALGGDFDQARKMLRNVERTDEADAGVRVPGVVLIKSYIIAAEGNPAEAIRLAKPMLNTASITRNYWPRSHEWSRFHAVMARQADDPEFAEQCVERAELASERNPGVASYQGLAVQVRGYVHRDPELIGTAVDILRHSPRPQLLAMALADHGEALLTTLRTDKAIDLLREAAVIMDRIGHHHHLTSINSTLQRAGVEPHQSKSGKSGTGWEALTHTERAVAKLIIQGQTNRAAAAHLGISINTVGTHLRAIFAKVGVHSRVQLTNAWNNQ